MTTVLVVDDSRAMRAIARRMIEHLGLSVSEAEHGEQARDLCLKSMPDGILLDWNMPVMDGPSFLRTLRLLPGGDAPKVVFCTTENDMGKIAEVLSLGANEFIMKPYDIEILRTKLAYVGLVAEDLMHITPATRTINVLVVDDSLVIRGLITRHLKDVPGVSVVGSASDGNKAVDAVARGGIDVVILDIEMPGMDGLTALPKMLAIDPKLVVIMASTLTTRNAAISLKALKLGAADYIPKPVANAEIYGAADFRRELIEKVTLLGRRRLGAAPLAKSRSAQVVPTLRAAATMRPQVLAIASSTGGPRALEMFLDALGHDIGVPVFVTQHMPPTFTALLSEHLSKSTGWPVAEAAEGQEPKAGEVLVAPGDRHLTLRAGRIHLDDGARENFCRPAADPMLRSLIARYGGRILSVVLTGMGHDGLLGCQSVVAAGGTVLAQDEASSVVWGMPGAVATNGLCAKIGTPAQLAESATQFIKSGTLP